MGRGSVPRAPGAQAGHGPGPRGMCALSALWGSDERMTVLHGGRGGDHGCLDACSRRCVPVDGDGVDRQRRWRGAAPSARVGPPRRPTIPHASRRGTLCVGGGGGAPGQGQCAAGFRRVPQGAAGCFILESGQMPPLRRTSRWRDPSHCAPGRPRSLSRTGPVWTDGHEKTAARRGGPNLQALAQSEKHAGLK